jgi:hypothetical protein
LPELPTPPSFSLPTISGVEPVITVETSTE